jgi:hypothetical protein
MDREGGFIRMEKLKKGLPFIRQPLLICATLYQSASSCGETTQTLQGIL